MVVWRLGPATAARTTTADESFAALAELAAVVRCRESSKVHPRVRLDRTTRLLKPLISLTDIDLIRPKLRRMEFGSMPYGALASHDNG